LTVNFTIASGGGGLSSPSAQTDANGVATVLYTAGTLTEVVQIEGVLAAAPDVRDRGIVYVAAATTAGAVATSASGVYTVGNLSPNFIQVMKTGAGTPPLGWAEFGGNPCPAATPGSRIVSPYVDVMVDDSAGVDAIVVTLKYTDTEHAAQHKLFWCNLGVWQQVTDTVSIDTGAADAGLHRHARRRRRSSSWRGRPSWGRTLCRRGHGGRLRGHGAGRPGADHLADAERESVSTASTSTAGWTRRGRATASPATRCPRRARAGCRASPTATTTSRRGPRRRRSTTGWRNCTGTATYRHGPLRVGGAGSVRVFLPAVQQGSVAEPPAGEPAPPAAPADVVDPAPDQGETPATEGLAPGVYLPLIGR
jgi:hypothetical protein